jgi:hypothetical protein
MPCFAGELELADGGVAQRLGGRGVLNPTHPQ